MTHSRLDAVLALRHAVEVEEPAEVIALARTESDTGTKVTTGFISRQGRVLAWKTSTGEHVLYGGAIRVADDYGWESAGTPRVYLFDTNDEDATADDAVRLFLSQSLTNGGAERFAGWRERIVALIPEEVGAKESKIIRTLADGTLERTHTYNVLDAYSTYARWVNQLANEFGSTDENLAAGISIPDTAPLEPLTPNIVQAWLMREAAQAQLDQARASLKFGLAAQARMHEHTSPDTDADVSIAELARSLHTDRPNLTRAIKAAEADAKLRNQLDDIERMQLPTRR
ncbi:hypothetical protein [Ruania alba]|uniref:Uncharacterized protein n=1 Tax=Ruania alba TaxID=648782 RepID=A0A1H5CC11_9MICO|nr:hypothetical protein [Ruania alba]SED63944.1 hypothetical protein SAMN04488554_0324 [Ruania alba]